VIRAYLRYLNLSTRAAESLIDLAIKLQSIGGVYGNQNPTEFMCLLLKLLQIQPEKEILIEYLQADEFKWVCLLMFERSQSNL
jgi:pre-mRNA-splicing factor 38A